jgi:hypothetical protein
MKNLAPVDETGDLPTYVQTYRVETFSIPGTLTVGTGMARLYFPRACTIINVIASVGTAPTGASVIFDVNKNGTTIFTTQGNRPTITASAFVDTSSVPDVTSIAAGDYLTVDLDQIGSTVAGADATVSIEVRVV